jgi:hypothetical protein
VLIILGWDFSFAPPHPDQLCLINSEERSTHYS